MSVSINPIKKAGVKADLVAGKSAREALRNNGYSEASVAHSTGMGVVKCSMEEIKSDLKALQVDVEYVLRGLKTEAESAPNPSDRIAALSWIGKHLAMFTDKLETATVEKEEAQFSLERLSRIKQANTQ